MSNRSKHVWKQKGEKSRYGNILNSFYSELTVKDENTELTSTSTIKNKEQKQSKSKIKRRPKSSKTQLKVFVNEYIKPIIWFIAFLVVSLFVWLFINDYNFNSKINVADNNINNLKQNINEIKTNKQLSDKVDNNSSILSEIKEDIIYIKTSFWKDIEYIKEKLNSSKKIWE